MAKYALPIALLLLLALSAAPALSSRVLLDSDSDSGSDSGSDSDEKCKSIKEILMASNTTFSYLLELLDDYDLLDSLDADFVGTAFAPTNAAFEKISDVLSGLNETQGLAVLTYHVSTKVVEKSDFTSKGKTIPTVLGVPLVVKKPSSILTKAEQTVKATGPIRACKAVAYVVGDVLLPAKP